ncbi:MAG TPA: hypothetical protein PLB25_01610 [Rhodoferax sp.]|nr:hypothetical protein [Rhodoferax sp.]
MVVSPDLPDVLCLGAAVGQTLADHAVWLAAVVPVVRFTRAASIA